MMSSCCVWPMTHHFLLSFSIFVAFVLEAFFVEYSVEKSDLQTSLERKIEELELAVAQYVTMTNTHTYSTTLRYINTSLSGEMTVLMDLKDPEHTFTVSDVRAAVNAPLFKSVPAHKPTN